MRKFRKENKYGTLHYQLGENQVILELENNCREVYKKFILNTLQVFNMNFFFRRFH